MSWAFYGHLAFFCSSFASAWGWCSQNRGEAGEERQKGVGLGRIRGGTPGVRRKDKPKRQTRANFQKSLRGWKD